MQQALEFAFSLTQARGEPSLCDWLLAIVRQGWQPRGALLGMLDVSGRQLQCRGWVGEQETTLSLAADDFTHPLALALCRDQVCTWESLHGGARIGPSGLRHMLAQAGTDSGIHCLPLHSHDGKPVAVLALLDTADCLKQWQAQDALALLTQIFTGQLTLIRDLGRSRRGVSDLQDSIRVMRGEGEQRRRQDERLKETLIGESRAIRQLREQIAKAAAHRLNVLIQGETGTGKEVVARLLHQCSARADKPFVAINCAAIPENLIESELFGYQKGAFSGAQSNKTGLVAQANGGTLFLDEVGDMPAGMQAKLLRVLETRHFRPLGGDKEVYSDFRLLAATHQPLEQRVSEGLFRQDLYHRLCQCLLMLTPLRERPDDISVLSEHFIAHFAVQEGKSFGALQRGFLKQLISYDFPGNVRELRNLLEVACAQTPSGQAITLSALPPEIHDRLTVEPDAYQDDFCHVSDLRQALQQFEASVIEARLRYFQGNRMRVAESLNIPKRTLDHKCQKLEVNG
ncbi:sigma-54 interaction domain-containing protein [Plesiomonas shigelloides]|uniref:sigma-54 interaction domain-containing protein n=1 Tax=Plesiomonas shigelloides TaxID=703 RepID=UPI00387EF16C